MNMSMPSLLASGLAAFTAMGSASANLVMNGSFELGPPVPDGAAYVVLAGGSTAMDSWVVTGVSVDYSGAGPATASDGDRFVALAGTPGPGGVQQELGTMVGETYQVSFDLSASPSGNVYEMMVSAGEESDIFSFDTAGHTAASPGWVRANWAFTATAETTLLSFENVHVPAEPNYGAWIDDVFVVPEPGVFSLIAVGLLALTAFSRRRDRNRS